MKTRLFALLCIAALVFSMCACGTPKTENPTAAPGDDTVDETAAADTAEPVTADVAGWTWTNAELDCYGYSTGGADCYLSFQYPDVFTPAESNESGEQYKGFYYNPADPEATANTSPYGIYAYFMQGGYGGHLSGFEEGVEGGLQERELGGRTVLFSELQQDENTGSHTFLYYASYDEDDWARIWVIVADPEPDGAFRQAFEQSMNFSK